MLRHLLRRRGPSRWLAAAATLALTATIGVTIASAAHAETFPIKDGFDRGGWTTEVVPGMTSVSISGIRKALSAPNTAKLDAYPNTPAEARIFRAITLSNGAPLPGECQASVFARVVMIPPIGQSPIPVQTNVQVYLRVHSGGPTGQIISTRGINVLHGEFEGTPPLAFSPMRWPADSRTVTVEIAAYRGVAVFDDFTFSC